MSKTDLPMAVAQATFTVFGVELVCVVLDDGRRVISTESFMRLMDAMASDEPPTPESVVEIARLSGWLRGQS